MKNILIPLALFILLELLFRITGIDRVGAEKFFQNIYDPLTRSIPGAQNPYTDVTEFLNKKGFRGQEFEKKKETGVTRIVCLGASRTFGMVPYDDAYPTILGELLKEKGKFEVINAGIPATNLYQHRLLFEEVFADSDVDILLLMPEPNYRPELKRFRDQMKSRRFRTLRAIHSGLSKSAVYRVTRRLVDSLKKPQPKSPDRKESYTQSDYQEDYREDLKALFDLSKQKDFKFLILGRLDQKYIEQIQKMEKPEDVEKKSIKALDDLTPFYFAQRQGIPYINLAADFVPYEETKEGLWVDPNHPGAFGNRLIAKRIVRELVNQ